VQTLKHLNTQRFLFIGLGFELSLVLNHLLKSAPHLKYNIAFTRQSSQKAIKQSQKIEIPYYLNNESAIENFKPDIIFVGVKPQDLAEVLFDIKNASFNWKHLISIVASTPFDLLCQLFTQKKITCVLPDDVIEMNNPKCIVDYCSNIQNDKLIKTIFYPTCKKMVKVKPAEMVFYNAAICQGNPLLALTSRLYRGHWSQFPKYVNSFFTELINCLSKQNSVKATKSLAQQLAEGYLKYAPELPMRSQIFKEVLVFVFEKMLLRTDYQKMDKATLLNQFSLWATPGGLDEIGHETVTTYLGEKHHDFVQLPTILMKAIIKRGNSLEQQIIDDYSLLES